MASSTIDNELHRLLFNLLSAFKETIFIPVIDIQINLFEILKDVTNWETKKMSAWRIGL